MFNPYTKLKNIKFVQDAIKMPEKSKRKRFSDKEIFSRLKTRDKKAFIEAYDKYINDIYRFILFKVNQKEEAEDISSQVFLKIWSYVQNNSLKDFKTLKGLLYRSARNLIIDHYRKKSRSQISLDEEKDNKLEIKDVSQDIEKYHELKSDLENVKANLLKLKEEYREIVILRYINELSFAEIALITGKTKGNIRVILYRAIKSLREIYNKNE